MWTCNRLDLGTLGSRPVMPKNLPGHCYPPPWWLWTSSYLRKRKGKLAMAAGQTKSAATTTGRPLLLPGHMRATNGTGDILSAHSIPFLWLRTAPLPPDIFPSPPPFPSFPYYKLPPLALCHHYIKEGTAPSQTNKPKSNWQARLLWKIQYSRRVSAHQCDLILFVRRFRVAIRKYDRLVDEF